MCVKIIPLKSRRRVSQHTLYLCSECLCLCVEHMYSLSVYVEVYVKDILYTFTVSLCEMRVGEHCLCFLCRLLYRIMRYSKSTIQ